MSYTNNITIKSSNTQQISRQTSPIKHNLDIMSTNGCEVYTVLYLNKNEETWIRINNLLKPLNAAPYELGWYVDASKESELLKLQDQLPDYTGPIQWPQYESFEDLKKSCITHHLELNFKPYDNELKNLKKTEALKKLASNFLAKEEPCKYFNMAAFPETLKNYINYLCQTNSNSHPATMAISVISMVSGSFKNKVYIPKGEYFQKLYPNLWFLTISKSGQFKTSALNQGASIAIEQEKEILNNIKRLEYSAAPAEQIRAQSLNKTILPVRITPEGLIDYLAQGHKGVIYLSEFGPWLQSLNKKYNSDLMGVLTDLYDCPSTWHSYTKGQGSSIIEDPFISICGVSTLNWLTKPGSGFSHDDVSGGFYPRFMFICPPHSSGIPKARPTRNETINISNNPELKFKLLLEDISQELETERELKLSDSAGLVFDDMHNQIYKMVHNTSSTTQEILDPFLKRWSPSILKLAIIMQILEDPKSEFIREKALYAALPIVITAIKSTIQLFEGKLGESDFQQKCNKLLAWIHTKYIEKGDISRSAIMMSKQLKGDTKEYESVLDMLVESLQIECVNKDYRGRDIHKTKWSYRPMI